MSDPRERDRRKRLANDQRRDVATFAELALANVRDMLARSGGAAPQHLARLPTE